MTRCVWLKVILGYIAKLCFKSKSLSRMVREMIQEEVYTLTEENWGMGSVLVRVLLLWTDTVTKSTLIRLQVQRFSPLSPRQEHGSIQAGMVQEEQRALHLHLKAASGRLASRQLGWGSYSPHPQWHTYSNRAKPSWVEHRQAIPGRENVSY